MKDNLAGVVVSLLALAFLVLVSAADNGVHLVGQTETIVSVAGDDVILPCSLRTSGVNSALEQAVEWQRPDLDSREVHFYRNLRDQNADQNPSYRGRTSLFRNELETGNISLKLTRVKLDDSGNYTCSVISLDRDKKIVIKLSVGAVSQPVISIVGPKDYGVILKCEAEAWTFKPEMTWLDSDGNILSDGSTETETDSEGHYTVRGHVTIQKTDHNTFTCRVQQQQINHKMETQIHVPGDVFPWSRWQKAGLIIGVLALLAVAVLVGPYTWRKLKRCKEQAKIMAMMRAMAMLVAEERAWRDMERRNATVEETKTELVKEEKEKKDSVSKLEILEDRVAEERAWRDMEKLESLIEAEKEKKRIEAELKKEKEDREKEKEDREKKKAELEKKKAELEERKTELVDKDLIIAEMAEMVDKDLIIVDKDLIIVDKDLIIAEMRREMEDKDKQIAEMAEMARLMEMKPLLGPGSNVEDVEMGVYINS